MRFVKLLLGVALLFGIVGQALGQGIVCNSNGPCQGTIKTNADAVVLPLTGGTASIYVTVGPTTWTGTVTFNQSGDGGADYVNASCSPQPSGTSISTATANGQWRCNGSGLTNFEVLATAAITGTATVTINASSGSAASGGQGGSATSVPFSGVTAGVNTYTLHIGSGGNLTLDSGAMLECASGSTCPPGSPTLNQVLDPTASKVFAMGGYSLTLTTGNFGVGAAPRLSTDIYAGRSPYISSPIYTSGGVHTKNDATFSGTPVLPVRQFCVEIDGLGGDGGPDTFSWGVAGSCTSGSTGVSITGSAQLLASATSVTFSSGPPYQGHNIGDTWTVTSSPGGIIDASTGFQIGDTATSGHCLVGSNGVYIDGACVTPGSPALSVQGADAAGTAFVGIPKVSFDATTGVINFASGGGFSCASGSTCTGQTAAQLNGGSGFATMLYTDTAVANALAATNPAIAVQVATTAAADTSGLTYINGVAGIGSTFTGSLNTAITIDGVTFTAVGQRLLVKNDTQSPSGAFNGIYSLTTLQTVGVAPVFTRVTDYDTPSNMNNTGAIPVQSGTANGSTSWLMTAQIVTVGTTPLTFAQFSYAPSAIPTLAANNVFTGANTMPSLTLSGSNAGFTDFTQGAAQTATANSVGFQAPVTVSSAYHITLPGAPAAGFVQRTNTTPSVESVAPIGAGDLPTIAVNKGGTGSTTQAAAFAAIGIPLALGAVTWNNAGNCTFAAASAPIAGGTVTTVSGQSCSLIPTGLVTWGSYTLKIVNASSTAATFTLGTSGASCSAWKVGGGGSGAVTLSGASAIDILAFTFDGTNCLANFRNNFN